MKSLSRVLRRGPLRQRVIRRPSRPRPALEVLEDRCVPAGAFVQTNLTSDIPGFAQNFDPNLINPWGLTASGTSPFWVSDNGTGVSTLYNGLGVPQPPGNNPPKNPLVVTIPPANVTAPHGTPTGTVFDTAFSPTSTAFDLVAGNNKTSAIFLFATLDGTISGWNPGVDPTHAIVKVSNPGSVYTGLAIGTDSHGDTLLYAANRTTKSIDVYDQNFTKVTSLPGNFTDPKLAADASPFNIQNINGKLYVEYTEGAGGPDKGFVDVFNTDGQRTSDPLIGGPGSHLNNPWGVALAPASFGQFGGDLLVGNFGTGTFGGNINAFDPTTGKFVGTLMTTSGQAFEEDHLWALRFGNDGGAGSSSTLFFTAGINNEKDGLFGSLQAVATLPANSPIVPNLGAFTKQALTTVPPNGDQNPYGVVFVPQDFQGGGKLAPGDILVSNFNDKANVQGTGSTIVRITPDGQQSVFFQSPQQLGLTTALGVLPQGFVLVGSAPATTLPDGTKTVGDGGLFVLDSSGKVVEELTDSALLQGPWDLTVGNVSRTHAQVFVSNVLSGSVTRIDLDIPTDGSAPQVESETRIASGFKHGTDPNALVVGPTGLAFDAKTDTLFVASTADNAIFAIKNAATATHSEGKGVAVVQDPQHLHGPLGLTLAPNGDLIAANGDAVNLNTKNANELVEFTQRGKFVGQFQLDPGQPGADFGVAIEDVHGQVRFAAVNDNTNQVEVFTVDLARKSHGKGDGAASPMGTPSMGMPSMSMPSMDMPSMDMPSMGLTTTGTPSMGGRTSLLTMIDQVFMTLDNQLEKLFPAEASLIHMFFTDLENMVAMELQMTHMG